MLDPVTIAYLMYKQNCLSLRFKLPADSWRAEFRPVEHQITGEDNAHFMIFMTLLAKLIIQGETNTAMPISKVDENNERAHAINAVQTQKFWLNLEGEVAENTMAEIIDDLLSKALPLI